MHHHLLDMVEPGEDFSAGKYVQLADSCVQDILSRGRTAVIAGGTGLYVDSLIAGRSFAPVPQTGRREALEPQLRENGGAAMLASWGLLAVLKATDTRQNASFAIRLPSRREDRRGAALAATFFFAFSHIKFSIIYFIIFCILFSIFYCLRDYFYTVDHFCLLRKEKRNCSNTTVGVYNYFFAI